MVAAGQVNPDNPNLAIVPPLDTVRQGGTVSAAANATTPNLLTARSTVTIGGASLAILPGEDLLGLALATGATLEAVRDAVRAAGAFVAGAQIQTSDAWVVRRATMLPGNAGFRLMLSAPSQSGGTNTNLEQLFSLVGFQLDPTDTFGGSDEGMPAGPSDGDNRVANPPAGSPWVYQQVLSISKFAHEYDANHPDPYAGLGGKARLRFQFNDVFGNQCLADANAPRLDLDVLYRDEIIGLGVWPGASALFEFVNGPVLRITLSFDTSRYAVTTKNPQAAVDQRIGLDAARYQQIRAQMARPEIAISARTPLDGEADHALGKAAFLGFIDGALAYLADRTVPAPTVLDQAIAADFPCVVFEAGASIFIARTGNIDPLFASEAAVSEAIQPLRPRYRQPAEQIDGPSVPTLDEFRQNFESAFQNKVWLALGQDDTGSQSLRAVQLQNDSVQYEVQTEANFFALPPLSTIPFSAPAVAIQPYASGVLGAPMKQSFRGIDLDVWGRGFLRDMDLALSPKFAAIAGQLDAASYQKIVDAKQLLSEAIAADAVLVVDSPSGVTPDQTAAQAALRERLQVLLSDAYSIDTIVQVPVTVTYPAGAAPAQVTIAAMSDSTLPVPATFSEATLELSPLQTAAHMTFFFESAGETQADHVSVSLKFQATSVRFGDSVANQVRFLKGRPARGDIALQIPVPVRAFPTPPVLGTQSITQDPKDTPAFIDLRSYHYTFSYTFLQAAQDRVTDATTFNLATPLAGDGGSTVDASQDLPLALAQWAAIAEGLKRDLAAGDPGTAALAVSVFASLATRIAAGWKAWVSPAPAVRAPATSAPLPPGPHVFAMNAKDLDILTHQNVLGSVDIARNADLLPGRPTKAAFIYRLPDVRFTNPLVPLVTNQTRFDIGTLPAPDWLPAGVDPLAGRLATLFGALLDVNPSSDETKGRYLRIAAAYEYVLAGGSSPRAIETVVPVLMKPTFLFNPKTQLIASGGFCDALAAGLKSWQHQNGIADGEGSWVFDVSVYTTLPGADISRPPLLELTNLRLRT
jgi:hypothetical protein